MLAYTIETLLLTLVGKKRKRGEPMETPVFPSHHTFIPIVRPMFPTMTTLIPSTDTVYKGYINVNKNVDQRELERTSLKQMRHQQETHYLVLPQNIVCARMLNSLEKTGLCLP